MWNALRGGRLGGHKFRRQAVIGDRIVDFFCPSKGLVVEIDGETHDPECDALADDRMLTENGFGTVRYENEEVMQNLDGVLEDLSLALANAPDRWAAARPTTPRPPPLKRRGSVGDSIRDGADLLAASSDTPRLDAELLMGYALGLSRSDMLLRAMRDDAPATFDPLVERRAAHEPVAYITGSAEFYGLELKVTPAVLIPRGDSETLIAAARDYFATRKAPQRILDLGTGSGALLLAALSQWPEAEGVGLDASMPALRVAQCNATTLGLAERTRFLRRSWRRDGWRRDLGQFDLVLCNPPYVEDDAPLDPCVRDHEPGSALFAGAEGLDDYRILLPQIAHLLTKDAIAIFEIGATQQDAVSGIARNQGLAPRFCNDLAKRPRAMIVSQSF
ncbi:peptide chain release factor N(5)-glutamine methyltransferase [Alteriqipengyuania lutimaris]|nr:peptide chain release factor N(5)-glutamine methyltransferase [Alteriqipengyuania lutimaris]